MNEQIKIFYENPSVRRCKLLTQWINNTDIDDYYDCTYGYFDYKLINGLLYIINNFKYNQIIEMIKTDNKKDRNELFILQYIHYGMKTISKTYNECLLIQLENIFKLYNLMVSSNYQSFTDFYKSKSYNLENKDLYLYRGFSGNVGIFLDIMNSKFTTYNGSSKIITTPFFLSTSVVKYVAMRFINSRDVSIEKKILWKIIVPNRFLNTFKYIYFDKGININNISNRYNFTENELLLNIGAKLKFISKITEENQEYFYNGRIITISYILYTFEFVGWSEKYIRNLDIKIDFFKSALADNKSKASSLNVNSLSDFYDSSSSLLHKNKKLKATDL
jgi:hypothetical protein